MSISIKNSKKISKSLIFIMQYKHHCISYKLDLQATCLPFCLLQIKASSKCKTKEERTLNIYNKKSLKTISYILQKLISPQVWLFKQLLNVYILLMASSISEIWSLSWFHCSGLREIPMRNFKETIKLCPMLKKNPQTIKS